eukprot:2575401-Heterocapsa_arctica.AAC.1
MEDAMKLIVEGNGLKKGTEGYRACIEMMGAFEEIAQSQHRLIAHLGTKPGNHPPEEGTQGASGNQE